MILACASPVAKAKYALATFSYKTFERYELDEVRLDPFQHRAWQAKREELVITSEDDRPLTCRCSALSPSTPQEGLQGEVVFLKRGDEEELAAHADEVRGRIVAAPYYPVARQLKTPLAARYGASALLEWRSFSGQLQPTRTCAFQQLGELPVASISLEDAEYLKRLQQRRGPVQLRLTLDSHIESKDSWNVVGQLTGADKPHEILVTGGHYDSWHVGPGATDNASGVVAVVEAARALAGVRQHLKRTVRFVAFGVEESGLVGSWAYVHQHKDELDDTILMINNDVGGRPSRLAIAGAEDLVPSMEEIAQGVPALGVGGETVNPDARLYGHTRADTADKVYPRGLSEAAAVNAQVLLAVANADERPARRRTHQELEQSFAGTHLQEALALVGMWPPQEVKNRYFDIENSPLA